VLLRVRDDELGSPERLLGLGLDRGQDLVRHGHLGASENRHADEHEAGQHADLAEDAVQLAAEPAQPEHHDHAAQRSDENRTRGAALGRFRWCPRRRSAGVECAEFLDAKEDAMPEPHDSRSPEEAARYDALERAIVREYLKQRRDYREQLADNIRWALAQAAIETEWLPALPGVSGSPPGVRYRIVLESEGGAELVACIPNLPDGSAAQVIEFPEIGGHAAMGMIARFLERFSEPPQPGPAEGS
jgi:hypothetical protein